MFYILCEAASRDSAYKTVLEHQIYKQFGSQRMVFPSVTPFHPSLWLCSLYKHSTPTVAPIISHAFVDRNLQQHLNQSLA